MRRVGRGLLVGMCAWSLACTASAQEVPPPSAPVVASVPGAAVVAFDHGAELCVGLRGEGPATCDAPPHGYFDPLVLGSAFNRAHVLYGVTTTAAVSIEVLEPGKRLSGPVGAGAYAGRFAGQARFFVVAITSQPYRVLLRDAAGRVVAGTDLGPTPPIGRPAALQHGRVGRAPWRAWVFQTTRLSPTPLDRGRTDRMTCVRVVVGSEPSRSRNCAAPQLDAASVALAPLEDCNPGALQVSGLAGTGVRRIDAVLGDGSRRRVTLHPLPAGFGDPRRAFALVLPAGIAVRALRVHAGSVRTIAIGQPPGGARCGTNQGLNAIIVGLVDIGSYATPTGPLIARDEGDLLCVGLGTIVAQDCQVPPIDPRVPRVDLRGSGARRSLIAIFPPEVAAVRLTLDAGVPLTVAATDLPDYTGRYAGLVHVAVVALPVGRHVYGTDELAADGKVVVHWPGPDLRPLPHTPAVLARLPAGIVVSGAGTCIQVGTGAPTRDRTACHTADVLKTLVAAPCGARRLVVVTRGRALQVTTDRGVIRGRRKGRFAIAVVPSDQALRAVRLAGKPLAIRLPPAARQCGYALQI